MKQREVQTRQFASFTPHPLPAGSERFSKLRDIIAASSKATMPFTKEGRKR